MTGTTFPQGAASENAKPDLDDGDQFLVRDKDSKQGAIVDAGVLNEKFGSGLRPVPDSGEGGRNLVSNPDVNSIAPNVHTSAILAGGYVGRENTIGSATHSTHTDNDYPGATLPNFALIAGSYDSLNNQQATVLFTPHSFAPATGGGTGHNATVGGSWSKVDGSYNAIVGGGGGSAVKNETGANAVGSVIAGGQYNYADDLYGLISGFTNRLDPGSQGSVAQGRDCLVKQPYVVATGGQQMAAQGDTMNLRWTCSRTITQTDISNSATRIGSIGTGTWPQFNDYNSNIAITGTAYVTVVATAGTASGEANHYKIEFGLTASGTQGASGWTSGLNWAEAVVGNNAYNRAFTTRIGDDNLTLGTTNVPSLEFHSSGWLIPRVAAAATTATTVNAIVSFDVNFTHWS